MAKIDRRAFIRTTGSTLALLSLRTTPLFSAPESNLELAVTKNADPAQLTRKAVDMLGGMARFVKKDQTVLVKPNIGWDRLPEQAANTNPEVVAEIVKMCFEAGAKRVRVMDRTCNQPQRCYKRSGIEEAAKKAGAEVRHIIESRFENVAIPKGQSIKSWPLYKDLLESDVFINVPIAKDHSISRVTLGLKNIMGLMGGDRGEIHKDFMTKIVDINTAVKPDLIIIDAFRVLKRNGPSGGNLADVEEKKVIVAGTDPVAADAYGVTLFGFKPQDMEFLRIAAQRGLGKLDLSQVNMKEFDFTA